MISNHSPKEWIEATRFWSFPVSVMPVIVTFAYLFSAGMVPAGGRPWLCLGLCIVSVMLLHSAGNVLSDWFDYRTGVDNPSAFAVPNLVFGKFKPSEYLHFSIFLFVAGSILGVVTTLLSGWWLLVTGVAGVALTASYSFWKYHALGDLDIFIIFSCLIMLGTGVAITGEIIPQTLLAALPVGVITVSVLHANNTVDIESDRAAGMKSFAMLIGGRASARLYQAYMVIPFLAVIVLVSCGLFPPFALVCLAALVPALKNLRAASHYDEKGIETLAGLDKASAALQLQFSLLLSAGLFLSGILGNVC